MKAYLLYTRDQAHHAKFQKDIQMPPTSPAPAEPDQDDGTNETKYICYVCGRTATKQGMAVHMGRDRPDHAHPRRWVTGTACRCCQTEFHTFPRLLKHLSAAHRCRKSWYA